MRVSKFSVTSAPKDPVSHMKSYLVSMNDGIRICSEACACCWDKPLPNTYEELCTYIGKRTNIGHTSILEHSSFVTVTKIPYLSVNDPKKPEFASFVLALAACRYLNVRIRYDEDNYWVLIGGSYRGYNEMIRRMPDLGDDIITTPFMRSLMRPIYDNLTSESMLDLINDGYLEADMFRGVEPDPVSDTFVPITRKYSSSKVEVISTDNIMKIRRNLSNIIGSELFTADDIMRVCGLTILFKDMSRTATHQLVRHRNGITQESQRYVDYSNAAFADPAEFKPDKYDPKKIYAIRFGGQVFRLTSMQIGEAIIGIYHDVMDQGMIKEDARAFLPGNVKCRKLYMTFTYQTFLKFLELRCAPGAQAEIRSFANDLKDHISEYIDLDSMKDETPIKGVDQIIGTKEEIFENLSKSEQFQNSVTDTQN